MLKRNTKCRKNVKYRDLHIDTRELSIICKSWKLKSR